MLLPLIKPGDESSGQKDADKKTKEPEAPKTQGKDAGPTKKKRSLLGSAPEAKKPEPEESVAPPPKKKKKSLLGSAPKPKPTVATPRPRPMMLPRPRPGLMPRPGMNMMHPRMLGMHPAIRRWSPQFRKHKLADVNVGTFLSNTNNMATAHTKIDSKYGQGPVDVSLDGLRRAQKLILALDIDKTIVHASHREKMMGNGEWFDDKKFIDVTSYVHSRSKKRHYIKLRPELTEFLDSVSQRYVLWIYTHGDREYAEVVVKYIDPDNKYFGNSVFSGEQQLLLHPPGTTTTATPPNTKFFGHFLLHFFDMFLRVF